MKFLVKLTLGGLLSKDEVMGHPFMSDLGSESDDDEFEAGDDSDEVCISRPLGTC